MDSGCHVGLGALCWARGAMWTRVAMLDSRSPLCWIPSAAMLDSRSLCWVLASKLGATGHSDVTISSRFLAGPIGSSALRVHLRPRVSHLKMLAWAPSTHPESFSHTNGTTLYDCVWCKLAICPFISFQRTGSGLTPDTPLTSAKLGGGPKLSTLASSVSPFRKGPWILQSTSELLVVLPHFSCCGHMRAEVDLRPD